MIVKNIIKLHNIWPNTWKLTEEKRYERVKRWTKKVNIFEKDFIVVPINDHQHWFVAVICFPGLEGCVRVDNNEKTEVPASQVKATEAQTLRRKKRKAGGAGSTPTKRVLQIGSTSIIPLQVRSLGQHKFKGRPSKTYAQNQYSRLRKIAKKYCEQ